MAIEHTPAMQALLLEREIEQFYYAEADMLDERRFNEWLDLFTDDVRYWMPLVANVQHRHLDKEYSREGVDNAWIDEDKRTLTQRVQQLATGIHWAEEPRSRMSHLITNVRILEIGPSLDSPRQLTTKCRFLIYRNRMETEVDLLVGKRSDVLRQEQGQWRVARREIYLDQNVLLSKNLTTFF